MNAEQDPTVELKLTRELLKKQIETCATDIKDIYDTGLSLESDVDQFELFSAMQDSLENSYQHFLSLWAEITRNSLALKLQFPSESFSKIYSDTKTFYFKTRAIYKKYQTIYTSIHQSEKTKHNYTLNESRFTRAHLPKIDLPTFDGANIADWPAYHDVFKALVHDDAALEPIEKFFFLHRSLKGQALSLISQFPLDGGNYDSAWQALNSAFAKKRVLASSYLNRVLDFKVTASRPSVDSLRSFITGVVDNISAFKNLKLPNGEDFLIFLLAVRGLDPITREAFEFRHSRDEFPSYESLVTFVRERCSALQLSTITHETSSSSFSSHSKRTLLVPPQVSSCCVCSAVHELYQCAKFKALDPKKRFDIVREHRRCVNCLSRDHTVSKCSSRIDCHTCGKRHHTLLHFPTSANSDSTSERETSPAPPTLPASGNVLSGFSNKSLSTQILLGTALITLRSSSGYSIMARAVLDSGSQYCFMTCDCAHKLNLAPKYFQGRIAGLGDTTISGRKGRVVCDITKDDTIFPDTTFIVVPEITSHLPAVSLNADVAKLFSAYNPADPTFWKSGPIDCLIGAQWFFKFLRGAPITINDDLPQIIPTVFGHVISGPMLSSPAPSSACTFFTSSPDSDLSRELERFWDSEEPSCSSTACLEDSLCTSHFNETTTRLPSGQYRVALPFISDPPTFEDLYHIALRRFLHMEGKLNKDPSFRQQYHNFMTEYLNLGHMEISSEPGRYYIPHHAVFKQVGDTKKIRIVFDASCKMPRTSLNDTLMKGPRLQSDIQELLTRFRLHKIVFTTDIVKMYRSILLRPEDTVYHHILWRWSDQSPITDFTLKTVTYGVKSSAFQAIATLMKLAADEREQYPNAAKILEEDIYVDDILTGSDTIHGASQLIQELICLLAKGGFSLSKWASNCPEILPSPEVTNERKPLSPNDDSVTKILGIEWDHHQDAFMYRISPPNTVFTKRGVLSAIARIYDPLGLIAPTVFFAKQFLQDLWKLRSDWDTPLSDELANKWKAWLDDLPSLQEHRIQRFIPLSEALSAQIIGFADASQKGFAAVCYLRLESSSGTTVHLLKSKSKLAPIKSPFTINRLELCAASLLVKIITSLDWLLTNPKINSVYLFSDSRVALSWIKASPHLIKTYVANRVKDIQAKSPDISVWRYIDTSENPSDCCSRGLMPSQLIHHDLWWSSPSWIKFPPSQWPNPEISTPTDLPEMKTLSLIAQDSTFFIDLFENFSSLEKLLHVICYVRRFVCLVSKSNRTSTFQGTIKTDELSEGRHLICRLTQQHFWPNTFKSNGKVMPKSLIPLSPYLDPSTQLLLVGGRLHNASLSESLKHPILIPRESHLAKLIVDHYHLKYFHADPTLLRSLIRQHYWIPSLRCVIRSRLSKCLRCYTLSKTPTVPLMSSLPPHRVAPSTRAFLQVGVDFAGPLLIRDSLRRKFTTSKAYLSIFVCMATKAIHLEVVSSLSTDAFMAALNRFISRRGRPSHFYSDRGTNFIGADRLCKDAYLWLYKLETQSVLDVYLTKESMKWTFHPPYAPHFSGLAEAAVRLTKSVLNKVIQTTPFTFEELTTITTQIEAILNSRPLCPLTENPHDINALTPGHFLIGAPLLATPEKSVLHLKEGRLSRWQLVQQRSQHFWQRWTNEYLLTLQKKSKWTEETPNLKEGDMVLLTDEVNPPLRWPLARISAVHPGKDGRVRVVTLKTSKGDYIRAVAKLISLSPVTNNY